MWKRIVALTAKEFLAILKDKKSRYSIIFPPIVQMLIFGYAATYDLTNVPYAVYNEDTGEVSRDLLSRFQGSDCFEEVARITHEAEVAPLVDRKKVLMVIHIDPRFTRDIMSGRTGKVQIIVDGRNSNTALLTLGYLRDIVTKFNEEWSEGHGGGGYPAEIVTRAWFNPNLLSRWFMVPGVVGQLTLVVTLMVTAMSVAREREEGTFDQLLVTPFRPAEILVGKALPGFIIGLGEATVIVLVAVFWFRVPLLGSLFTLYTGLVLFIFSAIGVGLMISALSVTMQQALLGAFLFLVPAVILSGFNTPIANMPEVVQYLTYLNPVRYLMIILRGVFLEQTPFRLLVSQFWPLAVIGAVTLTAAASLFRRRMY